MSFKEYLDTENSENSEKLGENFIPSQGYKATAEMIRKLSVQLDPKKALARGISKELGNGYLKDFAKMQKLIEELQDLWDEVDRDIRSAQ